MERVEQLRGKNMNEVVVVTVAYGLRLTRMRPRAVMHVARASFRVIQREQRKTMRGDGRSAKVRSIRRVVMCQRSHVLLYILYIPTVIDVTSFS